MGVISWIILGALAGWIAGMIVKSPSTGLIMNIALGIVGAIVGGLAMSLIGQTGVTGINIWSIFVSVIGAVVVIWVYNNVLAKR